MCRRMGRRQAPAIGSPGPASHIRGTRNLYQGVCRPRNHPVSSSQTASAPTTTPLTSQPDSRILDAASPEEIDQQTPQEICLRDRIKPSSAVGHAVDIAAYNSAAIHLKIPANAPSAIRGVASVISKLPAGKYTLGLPRPGGGNHIDPTNDVFLPVTSLDQPQKSPSRGNFRKDLSLILEPARTALTQAVDGNPAARIQFLYPDGVDHLHVTTIA
jgi:hypothetical protein